MLKRLFLALLVLVFSGFNMEVSAQIKLLSAKILSHSDSSALIGAHIVNLNTLNATNSYSDGTFLMPFEHGDTIRLSYVGYKDKFIYTGSLLLPDAIEITIYMKKEVIVLDPATVSTFRSKEEFADEFANKDIESKPQEVFTYDGPEKLEDVETDLNAHVPLGSPITFLYNKFSKEAKEKKRHGKAKEQDHREQVIRERYNIEVVKKVTGITSDEEAEAFMKNCPLEDDYVYRSTDYDIVKSIMECQRTNQ
ncbi:MAG: hypothetical protein CL840_21975 [Crocinitomicaceae bacterium]|nr:hypothetical protein [Crocinitomicaceae bacterium]|tara:strand:+ start:7718 stop:8470 length:753 start_codon:yes stop_codon:yes gene_type:complete